jgi:hypothetical protein
MERRKEKPAAADYWNYHGHYGNYYSYAYDLNIFLRIGDKRALFKPSPI